MWLAAAILAALTGLVIAGRRWLASRDRELVGRAVGRLLSAQADARARAQREIDQVERLAAQERRARLAEADERAGSLADMTDAEALEEIRRRLDEGGGSD